MNTILQIFKKEIWPRAKLWEFVVVDPIATVAKFKQVLQNTTTSTACAFFDLNEQSTDLDLLNKLKEFGLKNDGTGNRNANYIDLNVAIEIYGKIPFKSLSANNVESRTKKFQEAVDMLNYPQYLELDRDLDTIISNLFHRVIFPENSNTFRFVVEKSQENGI